MSRRSPRIRVRLRATVQLENSEAFLVCQTRDISREGCCLDTDQQIAPGTRLTVILMDPAVGAAVTVAGRVLREVEVAESGGVGVGIFFPEPSPEWADMVARHQGTNPQVAHAPPGHLHLRVVVVGDADRRRGALALYVTSGWDVRFASDAAGVREALAAGPVDAVIAEHELDDARWPQVLSTARAAQPAARRIVRAPLQGQPGPAAGRDEDLVHRVVDQDAGLEALLDALTADFNAPGPPSSGGLP